MKSMKFVVDPESRNLFGKDNEDIRNTYKKCIENPTLVICFVSAGIVFTLGICSIFISSVIIEVSAVLAMMLSFLMVVALWENNDKIVGKKLSLSEDELEEFADLKDLIAYDGMDIYKVSDQYYLPDEDEDLFDSNFYPLLTKCGLKNLQSRYSQSEIDEATTIIARMERNKETNQYEVVFDLK